MTKATHASDTKLNQTVSYKGKSGQIIANKLPYDQSDMLVVVQLEDGKVKTLSVHHLNLVSLESEYKLIMTKIEAATQLISEAAKIASGHNTSLGELDHNGDINLIDLVEEVETATAWNSSSVGC